LIAAKDTSFKKGKLSLWFTPGVVKYLLEYCIPLPHYYQGTKPIVESQLIYYIQNIQNTKKYHKGSKQNPNEFLISTEKLLKATNLPSYEEVKNSPTQCPRRQIIKPFEKALNNLQKEGLYSWEYRKKWDKQISDSQDVKKWDVFRNLYINIKIIWKTVELPKQLPTADNTQQKQSTEKVINNKQNCCKWVVQRRLFPREKCSNVFNILNIFNRQLQCAC
jgi:hypothetical protein